jgi:hypothetical protein
VDFKRTRGASDFHAVSNDTETGGADVTTNLAACEILIRDKPTEARPPISDRAFPDARKSEFECLERQYVLLED